MKIEVTQEDINNGKQGNATACPIALAATRAFKVSVLVGYSLLIVGEVWRGRTYKLSPAAYDFRRSFDVGEPVQPFTFEVPDAPHH